MTLINSQVSVMLDIHWANRSPELKGFLISKGATNTLDFWNSIGSAATKLKDLKQNDDQDAYIFAYKHQTIKGWFGLLQLYLHGTGGSDGLYVGNGIWAGSLGAFDIFDTLYGATFLYGVNSWGDNPVSSVNILPASVALSGLNPVPTDQWGGSYGGFASNNGCAPYGNNGDGTDGTTTAISIVALPSGNDLRGNAFSGSTYTSYKTTSNTKWNNAAGGANYSSGVNDNPVGHIDAFLQAALQWAFATTGTAANIALRTFLNKKADTGSNLSDTAAFALLKEMVLKFDPDLLVWIFINLCVDDSVALSSKAFSSVAADNLYSSINPFSSTGAFINHPGYSNGWWGWDETCAANPYVVVNNVIAQPVIGAWANNLTGRGTIALSALPQFVVPYYSFLYPCLQRYGAYDFSGTSRFNSITSTYPNYKLPPAWSSTTSHGGLFPTSIKTFGQTAIQPSNPSGNTTVNYNTPSTAVFGVPYQPYVNGATPTTTATVNGMGSIVLKPPGSTYSKSYLTTGNYGGDFNIFS